MKRPIIFFVVGIIISIMAICLSSILSFDPVYEIGAREIGHFIGFIGLSFMMYFYSNTCFKKKLLKIMNVIHVPVLILALVLSFIPSIRSSVTEFPIHWWVVFISVLYGLFVLAASNRFPRVETELEFIIMTYICMFLVSASWELGIQPFLDAYHSGPREYIQWHQFSSDMLGIFVAIVVLAASAKRAEIKGGVDT
ncbi:MULTISPECIES: hypothetical protein [Vibrio]|uniref:hypothetical protein n=1 Tax=Vibrio TaxID=662 RepID=UPI00215E47E4|nr:MULTISPECIES: hypothetical protein [Vibrio]MCS0125170.1 hypothetical protein [Vibrio alginolyticus]MCS0179030.1 hypothetical protein [Vibrio alginolyticus]MDW3154666.1 hypothetical protein [Vibrio sp. 779(2023)]